MKKLLSLYICLILFLIISSCGSSQNTSTNNTPSVNDSASWLFKAEQVRPTYGKSGVVNGYYTVTWQPGKLVVQLPYFGQAYGGADVRSGRSPLDFVSTDFTMTRRTVKNGKEIVITPRDNSEVRSMTFYFGNGSIAELSIIMMNRSGISFTGSIR
jgi:hypothetical protein